MNALFSQVAFGIIKDVVCVVLENMLDGCKGKFTLNY